MYISPHPFERDSLFYYVNRAGMVPRTTPSFHVRRNKTYCFCVVHCVLRGSGHILFRGKSHTLRQGQLFLLPPYESHEYASDPDDPMGLAFAEFYGANTVQLADYILSHAGPVFGGDVFSGGLARIGSVLAHLTDENWMDVNIGLYRLLMLLCETIEDRSSQGEGILEYVNDHITENLSLEAIAKKFGYNPAYFSRKFQQMAGLPLSQYILGHRISRACCLLITTQATIEEIALRLGFYDVSHFTSRFKQSEGVTPSAYRRQNQGLIDTN